MRISLIIAVCVVASGGAWAQGPDDSFAYRDELNDLREDVSVGEAIEALESAKIDPADLSRGDGTTLRSRHLIFGVPKLTDDRYDAAPGKAGFSIIVREPFVVGYSETMRCPIWVSQRWTRDEAKDEDRTPSLARDWLEDPDLPGATHIGTSYQGSTTGLDRGHMARHAMNRSWGLDGSIVGCLMSNSAPQHRTINRGPAWRDLEDAISAAVGPGEDRDAIWVISGSLFRDTENPAGEPVKADLNRAATTQDGFRVPYATYKIVAWFDRDGKFQARGYLFEQPYDVPAGQSPRSSHFSIPDQDRAAATFIRPIDEIELRAGVDFFPWLTDTVEDAVEAAREATMW